MSDLKELLAGIGDHAGVYDVTERALLLGRRRRTTRRAALGTAAAALAATAVLAGVTLPGRPAPEPATTPSPSPSALALSACTVAELPTPADIRPDEFRHVVGDASGRFQASRTTSIHGRPIVVVWADGAPSHDFAVAEQFTEVTAVSTTGSVVVMGLRFKDGTRGQTRYTPETWVYHAGRVSQLDGAAAYGSGINAAGSVVGMIEERHLVVWPDPEARPQRLKLPAGYTVAPPMSITDDGTVVAPLFRDGVSTIHVWSPDGTRRQLTSPATVDGAAVVESRPWRVADGWVAGTITTAQGELRRTYPARWNLGAGTVEWQPGPGTVQAVSPYGWAVLGDRSRTPTLVRGDTAVALPGLPATSPPARQRRFDGPFVTQISPDGRFLAGYQLDLNAKAPMYWALRWTCR